MGNMGIGPMCNDNGGICVFFIPVCSFTGRPLEWTYLWVAFQGPTIVIIVIIVIIAILAIIGIIVIVLMIIIFTIVSG